MKVTSNPASFRTPLSLKKSARLMPIALLFAAMILLPQTALKAAGTGSEELKSFSLFDARERGIQKDETARGLLTPTYDDILREDILEASYALQPDAALEIWTKTYPSELNLDSVANLKLAVKADNTPAMKEASLRFELRGSLGTQNIPVELRTSGWNYVRTPVEWGQIGKLNEAVLILKSPALSPLEGMLSVSAVFTPKPKPIAAPQMAVSAVRPLVPEAKPAAIPAPAKPAVKKAKPFTAESLSVMRLEEKGIRETKGAKGSFLGTLDEVAQKDVYEIDYAVTKASEVSFWSTGFPEGLKAAGINAVRVSTRAFGKNQGDEVKAQIVLTGTKSSQIIPYRMKTGWNTVQETIHWDTLGDLTKFEFALVPKAGLESARGSFNLAAEFVKQKIAAPVQFEEDKQLVYTQMDAGEKGVFNIGPSKGNIRTEFDEMARRDIWAFDYSLPQGSIVGVWSKSYPGDLGKDTADAVRIAVNVPEAKQLTEVAAKVEIKGENGVQTIPLELMAGQNIYNAAINWAIIGDLTEAVFIVMPMAKSPLAGEEEVWTSGTLKFEFNFRQLTFLDKYSAFIKIGLVILLSLLFFLMLLPFSKNSNHAPALIQLPEATFFHRIRQDLFYGLMAVVMAAVGLKLFELGTQSPLDTGFNFHFLFIAFMGAVIADLLKFKFTGRHLNADEAFQNILLTGLLAVASSKQELLQAPSDWGQLFMFSNLIALIAFLIYHIANAFSLGGSGKHLKPITGAMIILTPYLFNWLLLAENVNFLSALSGTLSFGLLAQWPIVSEMIGRLIVLFVFNEALVAAFGLGTKGRVIRDGKAHGLIFLVSLAMVAAPFIADLGSSAQVQSLPFIAHALVVMLTTMLSYAGLWGEVYLITGVALDGGHHREPTTQALSSHINIGMRKGAAYSGILVAILYFIKLLTNSPASQSLMSASPVAVGIIAGALLFPFLKTIIESFDGSMRFFERMRYSYTDKTLFLRGAVVGYGFAHMITTGMFQAPMSERIPFGCMIGLLASGGVSFLRDAFYGIKKQGGVQTWRLYFVDSLLGAFVGSAIAFYLDSLQIPVVIEKFKLYTSAGFDPAQYVTYPLLNKWGRIDLGTYSGGAKLLFTESLAGVINWSIAAWLFAINKVFMQAFFDKESAPIKSFFSKEGFAILVEHMIYVLRWGLWMSPIIFTFLRMMPEPAWYNQDGAIRTLFATYNNLTMSHEAFNAWSLQMFVWILAFDFFRILIWMDHMGLRVATLVNLSFLGMDKLDEKVSKFIGKAAAQRYIPEGVKRFTTWAPLLIPFYLPRGAEWDHVWNTAEAIQNANRGKGLLPALQALSLPALLGVIGAAILLCASVSFIIHILRNRAEKRKLKSHEIVNRDYRVTLRANGEVFSEVLSKEFFDVTRRSYDLMDPSGRVLFLVDAEEKIGSESRYWPIAGNFPRDKFIASKAEKSNESLRLTNAVNGVKTTVDISLPNQDDTIEVWDIEIENLSVKPRDLKMVPYLEWVLNGWIHDRFHTQYARLYPEMEYNAALNAILTWQKSTKSMGFVATDLAPEGFLSSRMDFIGRAQSIWSPRVLDTLAFQEPKNTPGYPTFDPIGSLLLNLSLAPKTAKRVRMVIGYAKDKKSAVELIQRHLKPIANPSLIHSKAEDKIPLIGHGEILPGTPQPYSSFLENGNKLRVHTPFTPRPYDHAMSNPIHSVMVTNRGLHTSCNGNSQQNRLTPDWADTVAKELPAEAIYLCDADTGEWFSPTYNPLNKPGAKYDCDFSVDGTSVFRMKDGPIASELTVFVPPKDPTGVYVLTIKNNSDRTRNIRVAPYFQLCLSFQPERAGKLLVKEDKKTNALYFSNPRNIFRTGWAFASMSIPADAVETERGRFFGKDRGVQKPFMAEKGIPDESELIDTRQIAGFVGTLEIAAGTEQTVAFVLGQTDTLKEASQIVRKYKSLESVFASLDETRLWWTNYTGTARIETNQPEFDHYQNWLKYQALAERIWARRGFYQTSGAYGFRDQLQDTVNLMWVDPALARKQIILHASQQFVEGDVYHWFFTLVDGRSAFSCRSQASDNPVWLPWAVSEYVRATGDMSILEEMASYCLSEFPYAGLPKNKHGIGHLYHRATRADTVYRHAMKSIDLVLEKRLGKNGLPLIQTGDWNDGLDEIGSEGKGESIWLGFFLYYILKNFLQVIEQKDGSARRGYYQKRMQELGNALERTWRTDRYLRAFHDDGTEIGIKDSGVWEIDALTAAWAVMCGINFDRNVTVFNTAVKTLERDNAILLGWPALREDTKPYLGRSSKYPEGVRENGMYCHGVQWMVRAARILAEEFEKRGDTKQADHYRETAYRLWLKISPIAHMQNGEIEIYGGQPNKQAADVLTNFDVGRMIWHGYTGAAGWMLKQAFEGVVGATLVRNQMILPDDLNKSRGDLKIRHVGRDISKSPIAKNGNPAQSARLRVLAPEA